VNELFASNLTDFTSLGDLPSIVPVRALRTFKSPKPSASASCAMPSVLRIRRAEFLERGARRAAPAGLWATSRAGELLRNFLNHLPEEQRRAARAELVSELETLKTPEGIRQESVRLVALATKPLQ
jgi:hypothetical protein